MLGFCKQHFFLNSSMSLVWCLFRFNEFPNFMESLWSIFVLHLLQVWTWLCISKCRGILYKRHSLSNLVFWRWFSTVAGQKTEAKVACVESGANGFPHFLTDVQPAKPGLGEGFFLLLFLFSVNASPGFHPQCNVKWNRKTRRESAHFWTNFTLFSKLIQNDSFLSLLVETSTIR